MFRPRSCQLICCFITNNTLMTWHPYQFGVFLRRVRFQSLSMFLPYS
jgi:hypothetical protein